MIEAGLYPTIFAFYRLIKQRGVIKPGRMNTDIFQTQPDFVYVLPVDQFPKAFEVADNIANRFRSSDLSTEEGCKPYVLRLNLEGLGFELDPNSILFRSRSPVELLKITLYERGRNGALITNYPVR